MFDFIILVYCSFLLFIIFLAFIYWFMFLNYRKTSVGNRRKKMNSLKYEIQYVLKLFFISLNYMSFLRKKYISLIKYYNN